MRHSEFFRIVLKLNLPRRRNPSVAFFLNDDGGGGGAGGKWDFLCYDRAVPFPDIDDIGDDGFVIGGVFKHPDVIGKPVRVRQLNRFKSQRIVFNL